jgi:WD40 repeat protein
MAEFNPKKATLHCELLFEGAWPTSVAFLDSGRRLAAGNRDGVLLLWDLPEQPTKEAPAPVRKLEGHTNAINRLVATDDGKLLISVSHDRSVRLWEPGVEATGSAEVIVDGEIREREAKRNPKSDALTKPGIKVGTQQAQHVFTVHRDWVHGLGLSRDQKRLITGDDTGLVCVWDLASRKEIGRWTGHPGDWVTSACLSPEGETAFVGEFCHPRGSFDRPPAQVRLFDVASGKEKLDFLKVLYPNVKVRDNSYGYASTWGAFVGMGLVASAFSPDGKLLALAQGGERPGICKIHLMDVATGKLVRSISSHQDGVCDVIFSADGQYLLSTGRDTMVRICQVADGKEVAQLGKGRGGQFKDWFHAVALSPDQEWVAAADISGRVFVWKMG